MASAVLPLSGVMAGVQTISILLVDDDLEFLKALTKVLEKEGYAVVPMTSAREAMEYVNQTRQQFHLVISDISMPGIKGTTFLTAWKKAFPSVPFVLITAFGDWGQYMETIQGGAFEYLSKPLEKAALLATVRRALASVQSPTDPGLTSRPTPAPRQLT